jgi:glycosyltransferase involved in cell wall biosynthesis
MKGRLTDDLHIAILSPIFRDPDRHGGITPVIWNICKELTRRSIRVDLLTMGTDETVPANFDLSKDIRIVTLKARHRLTTALELARYLKYTRPSALLAAGHRFNLAAVWAKRLAPDTRVILSVHNTVSHEADQRGRIQRMKRLSSVSHFYSWADGIIAVSKGVTDDLVANTRLSVSNIRVIHNPIVTPLLVARSKTPVDHPWFKMKDPPVILGAGRLSRQKAFHILIQAFARLEKKIECRLVILGEGPERAHLENLVNELGLDELVDMPGFIENPYSWMARASVFALSSIYEGFGNVLVEALAVGTPVVSSDCPSGPAEILNGGRYGHLVPPGDPHALADAILQTLRNPPDPGQCSEAAEPFGVDTVVDRYLDYLIVHKKLEK